MGAGSNSNTNKSLNDRKRRAAGRQDDKSPEKEAIADSGEPQLAKGATGGAFGKVGQANRKSGNTQGSGGGGGGAATNPSDVDVKPKKKTH